MEEQYDSVLLSILQNEGELVKFLDVILGFLYRKTDFYKILKSRNDRMGFPPGVAKKILLSEFDKFEKLAREKELAYEQQAKTTSSSKPTEKTTSAATEKAATTKTKQEAKKLKPNDDKKASPPATTKHSDTTTADKKDDSSKPVTQDKPDQAAQISKSESAASAGTTPPASSSEENVKKDDDENPELAKQQKIFQENPESYNGAIRENYSWSQHIQEVDAYIKIPAYIKKGKDVTVKIDRRHLKVGYTSDTGEFVMVVDGGLPWDVNKEDSIWSLVPGRHVHVNMEKKEERWWESLFTDEPKISVRKIDASRPMSDLDDEAQAKIEEMMYNEHRKRLGLPQSHEEKMYETMKKAWDAEGSPFKGQPFDPTAFSVNSSGIVTINNKNVAPPPVEGE